MEKASTMGLNVGSVSKSMIDVQALERVTEQILNQNKENTIDVQKLDLSKFNRVSLGTDLYAARTNGELALKAAKAATDFDLNLSQSFSANIQYLNSQAAQSLFTSKENNGKVVINVENAQKVDEEQVVLASSQVIETQDTNKDKKGSNPFMFYTSTEATDEKDDNNNIEASLKSINIFA